MQVDGVAVGSALAPLSLSAWGPLLSAPQSARQRTLITILTRLIPRTAITIRPPRRIIHRRHITRRYGVAGTPIAVPTTLVEYARAPAMAASRSPRWMGIYARKLSCFYGSG